MSVPRGFHPGYDVIANLSDLPASAARFGSHTHLKQTPRVVARQLSGNVMSKKTPKSGIKLAPEVGRRVAEFYRREYPKNTAKHLAREYGCAPDTAKKWLQGQCPSTEHLLAMWARRGRGFFAFVFATVDEDLAAIAELKESQEELRRVHQRSIEAYEKAFKHRD